MFNSIDPLTLLSLLGISYSLEDLKNSGELSLLCPFHADKNIGSFSLNINTFEFNCFSCHTSGKSALSFISQYLNISYKGAIKWLNDQTKSESLFISDKNYINSTLKLKEELKEIEQKNPLDYYPTQLESFKVNNIYYCKSHHISQIFVDFFNCNLSTEGYYKDYMIIPIYYNNKLFSFEARKLYEYEKLCEYYNLKFLNNVRQYKYLKEQFKKENFKLLKNNVLYKNGEKYFESDKEKYFLILYLIKPKVLYPKNSLEKTILFNIDNLNRNKPPYVMESLSSLSNVWTNLSDNSTATFGSKLSEQSLKLLSEFKELILIPDNDLAGLEMVKLIQENVSIPINILEVPSDAGEASIKDLKKELISIHRYIWRKNRLTNIKK